MFDNLEYLIFMYIIAPVIILIVIAVVITRALHRRASKNSDLAISTSKEDGVSQGFLLISFLFLGVTLLAFNKDLGDPLSWRTILLVTSVAALIGTYYFRAVNILIFALVGISLWWTAQAFYWVMKSSRVISGELSPSGIIVGILLIALLYYVTGRIHEKYIPYKRFSVVYVMLGIMAVTFALFMFSTKYGLMALGEMSRGGAALGSAGIAMSLFIILLALAVGLFVGVVSKRVSIVEVIGVVVLAALFGSILILPPQELFLKTASAYGSYNNGLLSPTGVLWAIIYNLAIFFELLGLIFLGYHRQEPWLVNLGIVFLFILIFVKYFDWFFASLDKSIFFIAAGVLLFVVGWFMEKGRKYVLTSMETVK